ncbi:Hypothetical protein Cul131001_0735 [Corynebacterium ulcerans]|uniref:Uncharacterized protein n=1 Tax=Corynebacterium ulcerans FRC58 TaxID=1408268 RepID=A0ABM5TZL4_CORUL|nr:Hypothetical protein Cul05146_0741 [Corynebacterium ulcerans]AKN76612.1 Hypothetical protein CulFRC58_0758 [Corynebacterium ulcerans FRC58]ALD94453.1 Hypothetical protein Cul131001_0735 [Corynebacterium ulcerans]
MEILCHGCAYWGIGKPEKNYKRMIFPASSPENSHRSGDVMATL